MIHFGAPGWLYALAIAPLLALLLRRAEARRRAQLQRLGDVRLLARLSVGADGRSERRRRWAPWVALALVLALARPRWGTSQEAVQTEAAQIMIALDVSTSMLAADMAPNRLERAKLEIRDLVGRLEGDQFGLVLFSGAAFVQCPLTVDTAMLQSFLDMASPAVISRPGTALASAIEAAQAGFDAERDGQKVILIFTDGEDPDSDPLSRAAAAADAGIRVYTVGFGTEAGAPVPEVDAAGQVIGTMRGEAGKELVTRPDMALLGELARAGGGRFQPAGAVGGAAQRLAEGLADLRRDTLSASGGRRPIERFAWPLGLGILLLLAGEWPARRRAP